MGCIWKLADVLQEVPWANATKCLTLTTRHLTHFNTYCKLHNRCDVRIPPLPRITYTHPISLCTISLHILFTMGKVAIWYDFKSFTHPIRDLRKWRIKSLQPGHSRLQPHGCVSSTVVEKLSYPKNTIEKTKTIKISQVDISFTEECNVNNEYRLDKNETGERNAGNVMKDGTTLSKLCTYKHSYNNNKNWIRQDY